MSKSVWHISIIAVVHFALFMIMFLLSFGHGMERFETGDEISQIESVLHMTYLVLAFPLITLTSYLKSMSFPGLWSYVPILANSFLWGFALSKGIQKIAKS
ncbi:hypothetical protein ACT3R7_20460 [Halomonas sp. AOP43-A1-21]|uniref:hypothetical protein n=1 Tax=Halomonas sp. TaxID=1486246 RepID=UPI003F8FC4BE